MRKGKLLSWTAGLLMGLCLISSGVFAEEETPGRVVDGSVLTRESQADCSAYLTEEELPEMESPVLSTEPALPVPGTEEMNVGTEPGPAPYGTYLAEGGCGISEEQTNIAQINGFTSCYRQAEYVYLGLFMDRLENGGWHTVYYKEVSADNCYNLSYSINVFVKTGYYYRVRSFHVVENGSVREGITCATNGIYFG